MRHRCVLTLISVLETVTVFANQHKLFKFMLSKREGIKDTQLSQRLRMMFSHSYLVWRIDRSTMLNWRSFATMLLRIICLRISSVIYFSTPVATFFLLIFHNRSGILYLAVKPVYPASGEEFGTRGRIELQSCGGRVSRSFTYG